MSARINVGQALIELCKETPGPETILFCVWFSAKEVAGRAGCSVGTAKKHLDQLASCAGYRRRQFKGNTGYRFDKPSY